MNKLSLSEIQDKLSGGELSCVQLVEHYLKNIAEKSHLNAFLEVFGDEALEHAKKVDQKIKEGTQGELAGMVVGIKDTIAYANHSLEASSKILDGYITPYSSTAVERLLSKDAIIIGRQNCDEFAMGASNETSAFGNVLNMDDNDKVPGGSSGGSAVAVQADMCLTSLGSDTGGSVRQPAAFCGVVGLKPSYSRVSRHGLIAYASSFDQIGVLSHHVDDAAKVMEVIAGSDSFDSTASLESVPAYSSKLKSGKKYKIAFINDCLNHEGISDSVGAAVKNVLEGLKSEGHSVEGIDFPYLEYMVPTYYILTTAEASSNLARYDGVRYGYRSETGSSLEEMYKNTRSEGFGEEVKRRIMLGTFALSSSYYDAYYTKAQKVRRLIKEKSEAILENYDFIIMPTAPTTAFGIGENSKDPIQMYLADIFTVQASLAGLPAISVPVGRDDNGMSIGCQIVGKAFDEAGIMDLASEIIQ